MAKAVEGILKMAQSKKTFRTPKGCIVAWAKIASNGVELGYRCPDSSGYRSENLHAFVKGARAIHFPGGEIEGVGARAGFVLSPKHVRCEKTASARALTCKVFNDRGAELSGPPRERRSVREGYALKLHERAMEADSPELHRKAAAAMRATAHIPARHGWGKLFRTGADWHEKLARELETRRR
jgi:hypothetical protein